MKKRAPFSLVLASTSPRRIDLMKQVGFEVRVEKPDTDEDPRKGESPRALVRRLAYEKASSVAARLDLGKGRALVIAADTTVVAPNGRTILNKPVDKAEAKKMLATLAGKKHTVLTGYCIYPVGDGELPVAVTRVVASKVQMRRLNEKEIEEYVATGEPMDKAGSYAAQGLGMALIESIVGSYTNVVGLPMCQLVTDLEEEFGIPLFGR